ncbi:MAG: zinc ribbon domain-containing protein [Bacillota bacterium]|nr:zinc ribbon domain-containing protein [Bacillota bacterium]
MLEILALVLLCNVNKKNALARGQKPGVYIALTLILWLGLELGAGFIGGAMNLGLGTYLLALFMAAIGGLISYLLAKFGKKGSYVPPAQAEMERVATNNEPLAVPAQITLVRISSMVSSLVAWTFSLNGTEIGRLKNGETLTFTTLQRRNVLVARDSYGNELPPYVFEVAPGARAELFFKISRFLPEQSTGLLEPSSQPAQAPQSVPVFEPVPAPQVAVPSPAAPVQAAFCYKCGTLMSENARFCDFCGAERFTLPPAAALHAAQLPTAPHQAQAAAPLAAAAPADKQLPDEPGVQKKQGMFAVWLGLWLIGAWFLNALIPVVSNMKFRYDGSFSGLILSVLLGCSTWLILQKEGRFRVLAAVLGLAAVLLSYLNYPMQLAYMYSGRFHLEMILSVRIMPQTHVGIWLWALLAIGGAALFYQLLHRKESAWRLPLTAILTALTSLLGQMIFVAITSPWLVQFPVQIFQLCLSLFVETAAFAVTLPVLASRSGMKTLVFRLTGWGLVWCWIALFGALSSIIIVIRGSLIPYMPIYSGQLLMYVAMLAGFILLIVGRRLGWYVLFFAMLTGLGGQFLLSSSAVMAGGRNYVGLLAASLAGVLNPVITWISIRGAWMRADAPSCVPLSFAQPSRPYRTFDRFVVIYNLLAGLVFFLSPFVSMIVYIPRFHPGMLPVLLIGLVAIILSVGSLTVMKRRYPTGLRVLGIVLFVFMTLILLAVVITSLRNL